MRRPTLVSAVLTVFLAVLVLAPAAQADKGVVGWIGNPTFRGEAFNELNSPNGIGVNSTGAGGVPAGTVYINDATNKRVMVTDRFGNFIAVWGFNVYGINEKQSFLLEAEGGTFKLGYGGQETTAIPYNANFTTVQNALNALTAISGAGGSVTATGFNFGTGQSTGTIAFGGTLSGTDVEQISVIPELAGANRLGGPPEAKMETTAQGKGGNFLGYEKCTDASFCAIGIQPAAPLPLGAFSTGAAIAVDQSDGSVYAGDRGALRVVKFTATGDPVLVFGQNVNKTKVDAAGTQAEKNVCTAASGNTCQAGVSAVTGGAIGTPGTGGFGLAVVPAGLPNAGNVLVGDGGNKRIQEFTGAGAWKKALGWDILPKASPSNIARNEVQKVTIPASDGTFTLKFGANTTPAIKWNATAAEVQTALNNLTSIKAGSGSVTVSGGPGDATGSSPYVVEFTGGALADIDVTQLEVNGRVLGAAAGRAVTCTGPAVVPPTTTTFRWLRNGVPIEGATSSSYVIQAADAGAAIQCETFSTSSTDSSNGSRQASVPVMNASPVPVSARPTPPASLPGVTGTFLPGQNVGVGQDGGYKLTCNTGSWTGSPTFTYQWFRSGVPLSGNGADTKTYTVQKADLKTRAFFQCAVTGTNASGAVTLFTTKVSGDSAYTSPQPSPPSSAANAAVIPDLASVQTTTPGSGLESCTVATECRAGATGAAPTPVGQYTSNEGPTRLAVDSTGAIYAVGAGRVDKFVPDGAPPGYIGSIFAPGFASTQPGPVDIAIGAGDSVLIEETFPSGATPVCPDGTASIQEWRVIEVNSAGTTLLSTGGECAGVRSGNGSTNRSLGVNTATGDLYLSQNSLNSTFAPPGNRMFILGGTSNPPAISVDDPVPTSTTALLSGSVTPNPILSLYLNPPKTTWQLQYKAAAASNWIRYRSPINIGSVSVPVPFRTTVTPLLPNSDYELQIIANQEFNAARTLSEVKSVKTLQAPPAILSTQVTKIRIDSATLGARVDPRGTDTDYYFEWGTTPNYGNKTPIGNVGAGQGGQTVTAPITGLSDLTYFFRVVAESEAGKSVGENQSFTFYPSTCPNSLVRQQTGAGYLPDCRAYELVTPGRANNTVINAFIGPASPEATNPSRFPFVAIVTPLDTGDDPPNKQDLYVSTRTSTGWHSKFIGLPVAEAMDWGGPPGTEGSPGIFMKNVQADPSLSKILLWKLGNIEERPVPFSNAPFLFGADGSLLDRFPTNLAEIPDGEDFLAPTSELLASPDLTHFLFTSDIPFLPGAGPDDIYDNDTVAGTLEIVSKDPTGTDFKGFPLQTSTDGSHILMSNATLPFCGTHGAACPPIPPADIYMRVDGHTYDVTDGHNGNFAGMTDDGRMVYFTSGENVTTDDTDTSIDLFRWSEETDTVTRVSTGTEGAGNDDACGAVEGWAPKCGVKLIATYEIQCNGQPARACAGIDFAYGGKPRPTFYNGVFGSQIGLYGGHPENENQLGRESGDFYFYSPEKLDGAANGAEGLQNLYVFRDGQPQFVAAFDPKPTCTLAGSLSGGVFCAAGPIARMQVSKDGRYAAFTSAGRVTGADNNGIEVMYRYDAIADDLVCVSCPPNGAAPTAGVFGSYNGRYLTDDGRTFFATVDPLTPVDTNKGMDVYEYVEGSPRLITGGTGQAMQPVCALCGIVAQSSHPGLIGVSNDGTDVYFATSDNLTPDDHNGGNSKIYNARAGGGFAVAAEPAPCQAADECHGPSSTKPAPIPSGTGSQLGGNGNLKPTADKAKKKKKQKAKKKKRSKKKKQDRSGRRHG